MDKRPSWSIKRRVSMFLASLLLLLTVVVVSPCVFFNRQFTDAQLSSPRVWALADLICMFIEDEGRMPRDWGEIEAAGLIVPSQKWGYVMTAAAGEEGRPIARAELLNRIEIRWGVCANDLLLDHERLLDRDGREPIYLVRDPEVAWWLGSEQGSTESMAASVFIYECLKGQHGAVTSRELRIANPDAAQDNARRDGADSGVTKADKP